MRALNFIRISASLCLALGFSACGSGNGNHKVGITHKIPGSADNSVESEKTKALLAASKEKDCLDMSAIMGVLTKDNTVYSVYTSDMDIGSFKAAASDNSSCVDFTPTDDQALRGMAFLKAKPHSALLPQMTSTPGKMLTTLTGIGNLLDVTAQNKCVSASLAKGDLVSGGDLLVRCKGPKQITVASSDNSVVVKYFLGPNSLTVTLFAALPPEAACGVTNLAFKNTTVISWNTAAEKLTVRRGFAQLFKTYMLDPIPELDAAFATTAPAAPGTPDTAPKKHIGPADFVQITNPTYFYMLNMLGLNAKLDPKLTCPGSAPATPTAPAAPAPPAAQDAPKAPAKN